MIFAAAALSACASDTPVYWVRADGMPVTGNALLQRTFDQDEAICQGEMAKADSASLAPAPRRLQADDAVYRGCMAARGYAPDKRRG